MGISVMKYIVGIGLNPNQTQNQSPIKKKAEADKQSLSSLTVAAHSHWEAFHQSAVLAPVPEILLSEVNAKTKKWKWKQKNSWKMVFSRGQESPSLSVWLPKAKLATSSPIIGLDTNWHKSHWTNAICVNCCWSTMCICQKAFVFWCH